MISMTFLLCSFYIENQHDSLWDALHVSSEFHNTTLMTQLLGSLSLFAYHSTNNNNFGVNGTFKLYWGILWTIPRWTPTDTAFPSAATLLCLCCAYRQSLELVKCIFCWEIALRSSMYRINEMLGDSARTGKDPRMILSEDGNFSLISGILGKQ